MTQTDTTLNLDALKGHWAGTPPELRFLLTPIQNDQQYRTALHTFELLLSEVEGSETLPEPTLELFHILAEHLHTYEKRDSLPAVPGQEVLRFLMEQHGLNQSDLPEVGSQGVVSEILGGKRSLNVRQAKALAERFKVSHTAFLT